MEISGNGSGGRQVTLCHVNWCVATIPSMADFFARNLFFDSDRSNMFRSVMMFVYM
jgi:hypothetical protein